MKEGYNIQSITHRYDLTFMKPPGTSIRREPVVRFGDDDPPYKYKPKRRVRSSSLSYITGALFAVSSALNFMTGYVQQKPINYFTGSMFGFCSVINIASGRMRRKHDEKMAELDAEIEKSMKALEELYAKPTPKKTKPWDSPGFNVPAEIKPLDDENPPKIN